MEPSKKELKLGLKIITTTITIVSLILIIYTLIHQDTLHQKFGNAVLVYDTPLLFIFSFLLDLTPQLISPAIILAASLLAGTNTTLAVTATALGSAAGSILGFAIGKKYMYKAVDLVTSKQTTKRLTHLTNKYGKMVVPLAAISPVPYLPILLGAMNFTKKNFLIYGIIPRIVSFIAIGYLI